MFGKRQVDGSVMCSSFVGKSPCLWLLLTLSIHQVSQRALFKPLTGMSGLTSGPLHHFPRGKN